MFELIQFFLCRKLVKSLLLLNSIEEIRYVRLTNNLLFNFIKETRNIRFVPSINSLRWNSPPGNPPLKLLRIKKIETLGEAEPHQNRRAIFRVCDFPW